MRDPGAIKDVLPEVRPTVMCAVPRFFEKIHTAILTKVETAKPAQRKIFNWAIGVGEQNFKVSQQGRTPNAMLKLQLAIAEKLVFSKLRAALGGRIRFMPVSYTHLTLPTKRIV